MNAYRLEIKWALIFTAVTIIWMMFERSMGWHDVNIAVHAGYTNFFAIAAIAVYVFALREKRAGLGGLMSWKEGFTFGVQMTIAVAILSPVAQLIIHTLISPEFLPNMVEYAVTNEVMEREQAEAYFSLIGYLMQGFIGAIAMGVITSAVVAFVLKRTSSAAEKS